MSESAPAWPVAPQPLDGPPIPPGTVEAAVYGAPQPTFAPPPPPPPAGMPVAPATLEGALDMGVPLMHQPSPAMPEAASFAPPSQAMPDYDQVPSGAMPTFESSLAAAPAATFEPALAPELAAPTPATSAAPASSTWWSPGTALVVAMLALAWQLVSFYAREQFPKREAAGLPLDRFDTLFGSMPLVGTPVGAFVGMAIAVAAGVLLYAGRSRGVREPVLQGTVGAMALLALVAPVALMKLAG